MNRDVGKSVADRLYLHADYLSQAAPEIRQRLDSAVATAGLAEPVFNLARFDRNAPSVALLHYPDFYDDPFPALAASWLVDLQAGTVSFRSYADSLNPPILHRKELLLPADHPRRAEYAALTEACAAIGLFDQPTRIGYRRQWGQLVREKGYRIVGHALVAIGNAEAEDLQDAVELAPLHAGLQAARHLTALQRYGFSAPVQSLARFGFLDGQRSLFDYGCGRGDDVRGLIENGLDAAGWDPYYAPGNPIQPAHIVNLGFVINVIEDFEERLEALTRAWSLAETLLVVSVMLANQNDVGGQRFRDGVMTRRGTFQKYYTQGEIKAFLESVLDEEAIPVAPGVLYCFRDKEAEQRFLMDRYRSRRSRLREPSLRAPVRERVERAPRERRDRAAARYAAYREPLDRLWTLWMQLGRRPDPSEVSDLVTLTEGFGSLPKALRFLAGRQDPAELEAAQGAHTADPSVYLALNQFERRRPYRHLEPGLQRDIKAFFGDYGVAQAEARELLFRIGDTQAIAAACRWASEQGLGWLEWEDCGTAALGAIPSAVLEPARSHRGEAPLLRGEGGSEGVEMQPKGSLTLHSGLVERLPPLLRVYLGCAAVLFGDVRSADLVKLHIGSGKV